LTEDNGPAFDIALFMDAMNGRIPLSLAPASKIEVLRANMPAVRSHLTDILDDYEKTEFAGELRLDGMKRPREKTLRKLYWYSADSPEAVAAYIEQLKRRNYTLRWRAPSLPTNYTNSPSDH
jgi:hypothetical protein